MSYAKTTTKKRARVTTKRKKRARAIASTAKEQRIDLRIQLDAKEIIQSAADSLGMSLSSFLVSTGLKAARRELSDLSEAKLSDRDRDLFLQSLDTPPAPNEVLRAAMQRFRQGA